MGTHFLATIGCIDRALFFGFALFVTVAVALAAHAPPDNAADKLPTLYLVGDSTVKNDFFTSADRTHTTKAGARTSAECVVAGLRELPVADFLVDSPGN